MGYKFQLNEGEVKRILNLHKTAIIKETKIIPINKTLILEKTYPITLKKREGWNSGGLKNNDVVTKVKEISSNKDLVQLNVTFKSGGEIEVNFQCETPDVMVIKGGDGQMDGSEYRVDEKFKNLVKWYCKGKPRSGSSDQNLTYSLKYDRTFTSKKNKEKTVTLKAGTILTFKPEKGGASFKFGNKFGWFSCSTTNISFGSKTSIRIYSANNEQFTKTLKGVCKKMGVTISDKGDGKDNSLTPDGNNIYSGTDRQNTQTQDPNEVLQSGFSDGNSTDRSLTLSCDNAEFAAKSCNDRSLRAQITINDNCEPQVLNDAIRNFEKGTVGVKDADMKLLEDGVWGEASKAAWEACKTNMRQGTSGSSEVSGSSGVSGTSGSAGSDGTNGTSGSVGLQGGEDLKLTDAEYVKLTS